MGLLASRFLELSVTVTHNPRSRRYYNVFHYVNSATISGTPSKQDFVTAFGTLLLAQWLAVISDECSVSTCFVRNFDDGTDLPLQCTLAGAGGIAGDMIPDDTAVVIQLPTTLRGRSFRGSKHFVGCPESSTDDDRLSGAGIIADWQTFAAKLKDPVGVGAASWAPVIWSRVRTGPVVNPTTIVTAPITTPVLNLTIGTMRGRKERTVTA